MKKLLFVCTGNSFRSWSAELLFRQYLEANGITDIEVSSAGTKANVEMNVDPHTIKTLESFGVVVPHHVPRIVTKEMLAESDLVVAMADYHLEQLKNTYGFTEAVLFNTILTGEHTSVLDLDDVVEDFKNNRSAVEAHIASIVTYLHESMPELYAPMKARYFVFLDLVSGAQTTNLGLPFMILQENTTAAAFMSVSIPENEDAHVLVVPKRRYMHLHNIPPQVFADMQSLIKRVGKVFDANYDGYNVLLNNGAEAGQYVFHVHFHVIPRKKGDGIEVQQWARRAVTADEYLKDDEHLKQLLDAETDDVLV